MEIWVYNQYTDSREVVKVGDDQVTIGRDEGNSIALHSPFVSRHHARIIHESGSYFLESLGLNGVVVANKHVPAHERKKIEYGDEIRIGEFSVYMMEPTARRVSTQQRTASPRKRVIELEQRMHSELLERLNLRVTGQAGSADHQHVVLIKRHLAEIIKAHQAEVDAEMGQHLVQEFLFRCVVTEVARRATGKLMYSYGFEDTDLLTPKMEEATARLIGDVLGSYPLRLVAHSMKEDVATIEADWENQLKKVWTRLTPERRS